MKYSSEQPQQQPKNLPDVALEQNTISMGPLAWVGMSRIQIPVLWSEGFKVPAFVDAQVSLDLKPSRGIHMSRLYLSVQDVLSTQPLSLQSAGLLLNEFLQSHSDLSSQARLMIHLQAPIQRRALKSENRGWRQYPVTFKIQKTAQVLRCFVQVHVTYSSTCPASAALSRQISQEEFAKHFSPQSTGIQREEVLNWLKSTEGMPATPHAQRSEAQVLVELNLPKLDLSKPDADANLKQDFQHVLVSIIDVVEGALKTPVQAAVKREDEQEFARLNGQNLMFCEDAARRVQAALESQSWVQDYLAQFEHFESLHPHNAVSLMRKSGSRLEGFI